MTWRRVDGEWRQGADEVARCACGRLLRRCCEDCVRVQCPECDDARLDWTDADTWTQDVPEGQSTLDVVAGGGETA